MRWVPAGDRAAVAVWEGGAETERGPAACAARIALARLPWVVDIVPAYDTVTVIYDPAAAAETAPDEGGGNTVWQYVESALHRASESGDGEAGAEPRLIEIPVRYGGAYGPDLEACAERAGMEPRAFIEAHASARYTVAMIGFMPGFPYLSGLPERLAQPRLASPRRRVPAGSVGIAGVQTGVYPFESPGGWQIIGRTDLKLFDPHAAEPSLLRAGDIVRFVPVGTGSGAEREDGPDGTPGGGEPPDAADFARADGGGVRVDASGATRAEPEADIRASGAAVRKETARPVLIVRSPGLLTTVQDGGRPGYRAIGVGAGGAMDEIALRTANLLVGNPERAAALEMTLAGAELEAADDLLIAVTGAGMEPTADGERLPLRRPVWVRRGTVIRFGRAARGCRAYLAVAGGIDVPPVLGGRGTDIRAGFGGADGRPLRAGDALPGGVPSAWAAAWAAELAAESAASGRGWAAPGWFAPPDGFVPAGGASDASDGVVLRAVPSDDIDAFAPEAVERFFRETYRAEPDSDRMGVRLTGPTIELDVRGEMRSRGVLPGAVQVPAGGRPIVLGADCQTTGGYPVIAHVAAVDLPLLAQIRPGDRVRFRPIGLDEAHRLLMLRERELRLFAAGLRCRLPDRIV
jgi:KipI family sensor histidine kinase inhibitor